MCAFNSRSLCSFIVPHAKSGQDKSSNIIGNDNPNNSVIRIIPSRVSTRISSVVYSGIRHLHAFADLGSVLRISEARDTEKAEELQLQLYSNKCSLPVPSPDAAACGSLIAACSQGATRGMIPFVSVYPFM